MTDDTVRYSQKTICNDNMEQSAIFFNISALMLDIPPPNFTKVILNSEGWERSLGSLMPSHSEQEREKDHSILSLKALNANLGAGTLTSLKEEQEFPGSDRYSGNVPSSVLRGLWKP